MCEIELFKCSERIINKYKKKVRNNENTSNLDIQKKLTRNFILGTEMFRESDRYVQRYYGKLIILVDLETMKIIDIKNKRQKFNKIYINPREKEELNKLLKIEGEK
jgi:hypothetical protein